MNLSPSFRDGFYVLALTCASVSASARAGDQDNIGSQFVLAVTDNDGGLGGLRVHLMAETACSITVDYPAIGTPSFTWSGSLAAGTSTDVYIGNAPLSAWVTDTVQSNAVRVYSASASQLFSVCASSRLTWSADTATALPTDALGREYIAVDYTPHITSHGEFAVWAVTNNTTVNITPSVALQGSHPAGVTYQVVLQEGECYDTRSSTSGAGGSITGTIITADNPVGFGSGDGLAFVPATTTASDTLFEFGLPVEHWGQYYVLANLPQRINGSVYRVVGSSNGTAWKLDGSLQATLNRGSYVELGPMAGEHVIAADHPVQVVQYMTGDDSPGAVQGDPAMCLVPAWTQYRARHRFVVPDLLGQLPPPPVYYATIIAETDDVGFLKLDNVVVTGFTAVNSSFSVARKVVTPGAHVIQSANDNIHGLTIEGYDDYESCEHPGGVQFVDTPTECPCSRTTNLWFDNFDSYSAGSLIVGLSGWQNAGAPNPQTIVTPVFSRSAPHSLQTDHNSDVALQFNGITSGKWFFSAYQYLPSPGSGPPAFYDHAQFILHSRFASSTRDPSVFIDFGAIAGSWAINAGSTTPLYGPLIYDQWVEILCEIDLDLDTVDVFYGGTRMAPTYSWSAGASAQGTGVTEIAAVELAMHSASSASYAFYDCLSLEHNDVSGSTVVVNVEPGTGSNPLTVDPKSATAKSGDIVQGNLPNDLAHSCDVSGRTATTLLVSFINANPTDGAWKLSAPIQPLGGASTQMCVQLSNSLPAGVYVYRAQILDQFGEVLCTIDPELVVLPNAGNYCTAGTSSNGCVPALSSSGSPSISASTFVLSVASVEGGKQGLLFYGISGPENVPWGTSSTSFLCVKPPIQRMGVQSSGGTSGNCDGSFVEVWATFVATHPSALGSPFSAGQVVDAQAWYRDPATAKTTNLSDALEFTLMP